MVGTDRTPEGGPVFLKQKSCFLFWSKGHQTKQNARHSTFEYPKPATLFLGPIITGGINRNSQSGSRQLELDKSSCMPRGGRLLRIYGEAHPWAQSAPKESEVTKQDIGTLQKKCQTSSCEAPKRPTKHFYFSWGRKNSKFSDPELSLWVGWVPGRRKTALVHHRDEHCNQYACTCNQHSSSCDKYFTGQSQNCD